MSDLLSRVPVSDADHPAPQNHAAEQEQFLEEYKRNMARLLNASEGFCVLHQLLAGDESRDVHLNDSGRSGLALIFKLLGDESMDAWSCLPNSEGRKFRTGLLMLVVNIVITMGALAFCDRQEECLARAGISVEQLLREGVRHE